MKLKIAKHKKRTYSSHSYKGQSSKTFPVKVVSKSQEDMNVLVTKSVAGHISVQSKVEILGVQKPILGKVLDINNSSRGAVITIQPIASSVIDVKFPIVGSCGRTPRSYGKFSASSRPHLIIRKIDDTEDTGPDIKTIKKGKDYEG